MRIIKNDSKIEIPAWLVLLGMAELIDIVQMIIKAVTTKKSN